MEYLKFFIALWVVQSGENTINAKLLEYIINKLIFEFSSIIRQYVPGAHVNEKVVVNEDKMIVSVFLLGIAKLPAILSNGQ